MSAGTGEAETVREGEEELEFAFFGSDKRLSKEKVGMMQMLRRLPHLVRRTMGMAWEVDRRGAVVLIGCQVVLAFMEAFGLAATICLQASINIAVATVSMPTKGMSLPLVSAGGTGLILTCASLGLLANVLRVRQELESKETPAAETVNRSPAVA